MSKISGFDMGKDEFQIPANRLVGQDGAVEIPKKLSVNEKNSVSMMRELQSSSELFLKKLAKINALVSSLEVDEDTDTVMMDKEFVTKLVKLVNQAQNDFNRIIAAASS
jgi:hypothetical protein